MENLLKLKDFILENSYDAILSYSPVTENNEITDFVIEYLNQTAAALQGHEKEYFIGQRMTNVFPWVKEHRFLQDMIQVYETGTSIEVQHYFDIGLWTRIFIRRYKDILIVYYKDITQKKQLEIEIEKKNAELKIMMHEIHHRVKNSLQLISSLLNIQKAALPDEKLNHILDVCIARIQTVASIHQRLYEEKATSVAGLKEFVEEMVNKIINIYSDTQEVKVKFDIDNFMLEVDDLMRLGMIINELITNTFKYAFEGVKKKEIRIQIRLLGDYYYLEYSDSGKGMPEEFDMNSTQTLGMMIIREYTETMSGKLEYTKYPLTFLLTFPAPGR
ncbi:MAG: histidine kinase dimerization/phosphoacceptor domain -containing protein [Methanococcaceae archaeon]